MKKILLAIALCSLTACQTKQNDSFDADQALKYCSGQVKQALAQLQDGNGTYDFTMEPRNILEGETRWNCRKASSEEWCSGFWPGVLWMTYEYTKDDSIRKTAEGYTESLNFLAAQPVYDHDLGFLVINSFLKGFEATGNEHYKQVAMAAADTLATLYNEKVGTILSWPRHVKDYGGHNTIMDNMINLELLFWASANGGSQTLRDIAIRHAETTMNNHFRPDGSCYHVAVYDTLDGHFIKGVTHQGYADSSMWSRGQSWAIYGYTMVYRFTRDQRFLDHAQKVTDIYLKRLHETSDDWVPLWDMDDPRGLQAPKDASAACVVASALLELQQYVDAEKAGEYMRAAENMLRDLSSDRYQSRDKNVAFLLHSTGHHPAGSEIDASIIYADYYYIEALLRWKKVGQRNFTVVLSPVKIHRLAKGNLGHAVMVAAEHEVDARPGFIHGRPRFFQKRPRFFRGRPKFYIIGSLGATGATGATRATVTDGTGVFPFSSWCSISMEPAFSASLPCYRCQ